MEVVEVQEPYMLTTLPNEVLVRVLLYLDPRSLLNVHASCRRLRQVTSDPICWPAELSWLCNNRIRDIDALKMVLKLSKNVLKRFSMSCETKGYPLYKYIDRIQACHSVESVSLMQVDYTEKQLEKLLCLPSLTYLHIDLPKKSAHIELTFKTIATSGCSGLKTLSTEVHSSMYMLTVREWTKWKCCPSDFRVSVRPRVQIAEDFTSKVLALQPSIKHCGYLTLYTPTGNVPARPHFQCQFAPNSTLSLARLDSKSYPLVLTAENPSSGIFTCATCNIFCQNNYEVSEFPDSVTTIDLLRGSSVPSSLEATAQLCPNLLHLDLHGYFNISAILKELSAVAVCCPKLEVLNLLGHKHDDHHCGLKLFEIIKSISSLKVLSIPLHLLADLSEPLCMPHLTKLHLEGCNYHMGETIGFFGDHPRNIGSQFKFLTGLPSLQVFECNSLPPVSLCYGISKFLHASPNLTHLYLVKASGNKLTLPTNPACYRHLQKMLLQCFDFVVHEDLASTLSQSEDLRVLVLIVHSVAIKGIIELANSLKSLSLFHIFAASDCGLKSQVKANAFAKSMREICKKKGRLVDLKVYIKCQPRSYADLAPIYRF